ncbi:MAG: SPOR domain-containing protein [Proteobacteria bacterium]|nr:SPOR domain-containing protein [Pseudomonadota bacterium]
MTYQHTGPVLVALALLLGGCGDPDFEAASRANTPAAFEEYLQAHPDGAHVREARERLNQLSDDRDWDRAHAAATAESYQKYLRSYPQGAHTHEALIAIANLNLGAPTSTPAPASVSAPDAAAARVPAAAVAPKAEAPPPAAGPPAAVTPSVAATPKTVATPKSARAPKVVAAAAPIPKGPAAGSGGYRVQLGAYGENRAAAERGWKLLLARHPALAARTPDIVAAKDAAGRPIQRLQVAGFTKPEAESFCREALAGDPCLVVPPAPGSR